MPFRTVLVLLGALLSFMGASLLSERSARASELARLSPRLGDAPLCDDRGASAYAADPAPQPIDAGDVTQTPESPCKAILAAANAAPSKDDLSRTPEVGHDSNTLVPPAPMMVPVATSVEAERTVILDRPGGDHRRNDNPPPKPIPWRS